MNVWRWEETREPSRSPSWRGGHGRAPQGVRGPGRGEERSKGDIFWLSSCKCWVTVGYTQHKVRGENRVGDFRGIRMYVVLQTMRSQGEREGGAVGQGQNLGPH